MRQVETVSITQEVERFERSRGREVERLSGTPDRIPLRISFMSTRAFSMGSSIARSCAMLASIVGTRLRRLDLESFLYRLVLMIPWRCGRQTR